MDSLRELPRENREIPAERERDEAVLSNKR